MGDDKLVIVHVCYSQPEALVCKSALEAAGIPVLIHSRETGAVAGHMMVALGGMQVMVPAAAEEEARAILEQAASVPADDPLPESTAFQQAPIRNSLWIVCGWMLGMIYMPTWLRKRR